MKAAIISTAGGSVAGPLTLYQVIWSGGTGSVACKVVCDAGMTLFDITLAANASSWMPYTFPQGLACTASISVPTLTGGDVLVYYTAGG